MKLWLGFQVLITKQCISSFQLFLFYFYFFSFKFWYGLCPDRVLSFFQQKEKRLGHAGSHECPIRTGWPKRSKQDIEDFHMLLI